MSEITEEKMNEIITDFKNSGPWNGTIAERKAKFENVFYRLCEASGRDIEGWHLEFEIPNRFSEWTNSGSSHTNFDGKRVVLRGRLSVITLLHEFAHVYFGMGNPEMMQIEANEFAEEMFKKYFPEKFERLEKDLETGMFQKKKEE
jgi:hypothetical protein